VDEERLICFYVNFVSFTVNTKVEVRFNVDTATWISDLVKNKLKEQVSTIQKVQ